MNLPTQLIGKPDGVHGDVDRWLTEYYESGKAARASGRSADAWRN